MQKNDSVQAVLFDLDGTLADTLPLLKMIYQKVFAELNLPWADGEVMRWIGRTLKDIALHFAGDRADEFITLYQHTIMPNTINMRHFFPAAANCWYRLNKRRY